MKFLARLTIAAARRILGSYGAVFLRVPGRETERVLLGKILAALNRTTRGPEASINNFEFSVFSQFGDDGIIQRLIESIPNISPRFVEIGVGSDYRESNTCFLVLNNNWEGLLIEADPSSVARIRNDDVMWKHSLCLVEKFVDAENVNDLFRESGFSENVGFLSLDIDGMDYWIWRALETVAPRIVVVEYNALFGPEVSAVVPYEAHFERLKHHHSGLYYGASLRALVELGEQKGYAFVGTNLAGSNAFFVHRPLPKEIAELSVAQGFHKSAFQDARDRSGNFSFLRGRARLNEIRHLSLLDLSQGEVRSIHSLCGDKACSE